MSTFLVELFRIIFETISLWKTHFTVNLIKRCASFKLLSKMVFTLQQKTEIIPIYGKCRRCVRRTAIIFNEKYPNHILYHKYVLELITNFNLIRSVTTKKGIYRRRVF